MEGGLNYVGPASDSIVEWGLECAEQRGTTWDKILQAPLNDLNWLIVLGAGQDANMAMR